jgi:hypothetical protein
MVLPSSRLSCQATCIDRAEGKPFGGKVAISALSHPSKLADQKLERISLQFRMRMEGPPLCLLRFSLLSKPRPPHL